MEASTELIVSTHRSWFAQDLSDSSPAGITVRHDWGLDVPEVTSGVRTCFWAPTGHAARLRHAGLAQGLVAPGPHFLSRLAATHPELVGRPVWSGTLAEIADAPLAGHVKPAEMKVESLPSQWWTTTEFTTAAALAGLAQDSVIQVSSRDMGWEVEHRAMVCGHRVWSVGAYLDGDAVFDPSWVDREDPDITGATAFARDVVAHLGDDQPPAFTLDIGRDAVGRWTVVEVNPVFSAAIYGCAPHLVIPVILAANDTAGAYPQWQWEPDPMLARAAARRPLARRVGVDNK